MGAARRHVWLDDRCGRADLRKFVKTLHIWVPWTANRFPWLQLFYVLSKEATGLRSIELGWGANCDYLWHLERGAKERGLGDNLDFVRALGMIQGLEKLIFEGYCVSRTRNADFV